MTESRTRYRIGVDIGGTFTDAAVERVIACRRTAVAFAGKIPDGATRRSTEDIEEEHYLRHGMRCESGRQ